MDTFGSKLQQKALQQPKQKKSKSAEFLMGREESATIVGIENPAFDGGGSSELPIPPSWLGRKIRGDRPDSTLAAHGKKTELQAPAKERGNERAQNYFDPSSAAQADPRHRSAAGVSAEDELELTMLNADENKLYEKMAALLDEDDTLIDIPGTLQASRDEEVLEVKAGDLVLQRRPLLHSGGDASGSRSSQAPTNANTQAEGGFELGGEAELEERRTVMGSESAVKMKTNEEVIPHYAQQLRERVRPDMITLGSLLLQQQLAQKRPEKKSEWAKRRKRLMAFFAGNVEDSSLQRDCDERERPALRVNPPFQCGSMEDPSIRALGEGREEVKYGQTTELPESSNLTSWLKWKKDRSTCPQPVEVCVYCLRATRDKLPRGLYSVSVALHSHLGGPALALKTRKELQSWAVFTQPTEHRGRFYDHNLQINQSLIMNLLPSGDITAPMILVFKLINVFDHGGHPNSIEAWGAFPVCGTNLDLVQGRFKTPLLRGEPNTRLNQFKKIENLISSDLDHWLCNLYFQIKRLPPGIYEKQELLTAASPPPLLKPEVHHDRPHKHPSPRPRPTSQSQSCPQPVHPQSQSQLFAGPGCRAGDPTTVLHSHQGSPIHLSAGSACSSSSLPGKNDSSEGFCGNTGEKSDPCREKTDGGIHWKKKPIKKTNSCGPSMRGRSAPPQQADKQRMQPSVENLTTEEMEEFMFSLQSTPTGPDSRPPCLSDRARLALCMLPSELGLPLPRQQQQQQLHGGWHGSAQQLGLIMLLLALMWFVRLYLHYCSQWLYLQAIAVPVNKFSFHAHTVDLVYQSSLLHTREELAMVVVGPLTLNAVTFLLVLIRWGCQLIFGSLPSFTSKFIMAKGVWTVLDPLAVFAVDAVLGRLSYDPDRPVGDAAKLYWHFYRADQSGAAGVIITLFLYTVHFLLSITILSVYFLRFHNNGHMQDIFQRLTAKEGAYFLPQDLELSNQELSYIIKKAEQWRGFNGERRKVAVYDHTWTAEDSPLEGEEPHREGAPCPTEGETSTHVIIYTLYLSGMKQKHRHFVRQADGTITEVIGEVEGVDKADILEHSRDQSSTSQTKAKGGACSSLQLRKRKKLFGRCHRVEPVGGSGSSFAPQELHE